MQEQVKLCTAHPLDIFTNCYRVSSNCMTVCIARHFSVRPVLLCYVFKFSVLSRNSSQEVSSLTGIFCIMLSWIEVLCTPHPTISPLPPPRMHYYRQKQWWSAYLLLMTGLTRRRSLKGMWAVRAHVHINIFWCCRHYLPCAVGLQGVYSHVGRYSRLYCAASLFIISLRLL